MTTAFLFILLFVFMLIGMPIAIALGLSSVLTILFFGKDSLASLSLKLFETSEHFTLLAIPFFILAGAFMTTGGVARRMIRFAIACVGHLRGGLAIASVLACMLFAAVSGSSPATRITSYNVCYTKLLRSRVEADRPGGDHLDRDRLLLFGHVDNSKSAFADLL